MLDNVKIYNDLKTKVNENNIFLNEPMSLHTSFRTGGNADVFIKIQNENELEYILKYAKENQIQITIIGNGTNLLVRDNGIRGIVIKFQMQDVKIEGNGDTITIITGAGMSLSKLSRIAKEHSAQGLEFAVGIPGTVGGAIKMNAGAYGSEIKEVVKETTYIDFDGNIKTINNNEHNFSYRNSIFSKIDGIIIKTVIELPKGNLEEIENKMKKNISSRNEKQPLDKPNAGSTFKRGEGFITAKLIDECGLKGYKIGGAEVSTKHAGFVVNAGEATSKDILDLIEYIKKEVNKKFNVSIEPEIQIVGEE